MLNDIKIMTIDSVTGTATLSLNKLSEKVSGVDTLVQKIALAILNLRGTNAYNTNKGSELAGLLGSTIYTDDQIEVVRTLITMGIANIEKTILNEQATELFLDLEDKLSKIEISEISHDALNAAWRIKLFIYTQAGSVEFLGI